MYIKKNITRVGSEEQYGPRTAGEILRDLYPHTEPCVDLKLLTRQPGRISLGSILRGVLTRNGEEHYTFCETQPSKSCKRNPQVFYGKYNHHHPWG